MKYGSGVEGKCKLTIVSSVADPVHLNCPGSDLLWAVLRIRIHFLRIRIRIRAWKLNTDPDPSQYYGARKFICPYR